MGAAAIRDRLADETGAIDPEELNKDSVAGASGMEPVPLGACAAGILRSVGGQIHIQADGQE